MKKRITVCFFGTYDKNFTSNKIVFKGLVNAGVKVLTVNAHTPVTKLNSEGDASAFNFIFRVLRKYRIFVEIAKNLKGIQKSDVIYVGYPGHVDVAFAYLLKKIFNKKLIFNPLIILYTGLTEEQAIVGKNSLRAKIVKWGETLIYQMCDLILADTPFQKEHINREFGISKRKIEVLPIGADNEVYKYAPKRKNDGYFNVVYYGLYSPAHGVRHLVEAANILKNNKKIRFLMVGDGNTYAKDFALAQKYGLKNMIFYKGMTEVDAFETLSTGDVFIGFLEKHPVVEKVVPNKVYQGLALGKAVLTADSPAIRGVLEDGKEVILCQAANPESIAQSILELYKNPKLTIKISEKGHLKFKQKFTPKKVGEQLSSLIKRIV